MSLLYSLIIYIISNTIIKLLDNFKNIVYVFNRINRAFSLLGKSEKNFEVTTILNEFGVSQPFELDFNLKLNEVTNIYGNYDWKRDYDNAYEWTISEFKVLLVFNDDNSKLLEICYGLPQ